MTDNYDWNALAENAEAGRLASVPGTDVRGDDAANNGRNALLAATSTDSIEEAKYIALGRPRLAAEGEQSVTWKVRASIKLDDMVNELAMREGLTRSALIRNAIAEYAHSHRAG